MMTAQATLFLAAAAYGVVMALVFDLFRAVRITLKTGSALTAITDIVYVIIAFSGAVYVVWRYGSGKFRFYEPLGLTLGAVIYFGLISRFILKVFLFIVKKICEIIGFILKILLTPLRFLYKILIVPTRKRISAIKQRRRCDNAGEYGKQGNGIRKEP